MKKIIILIIISFLFSCSGTKMKDVAAFEFDNAWYWVIQYSDKTVPIQDAENYVKMYANPKQTSYFFFYNDSLDISTLKTERFGLQKFSKFITDNPPALGYYKIPLDDKLYNDAIWLISFANKPK